jgi:RHS repeat-associated protein
VTRTHNLQNQVTGVGSASLSFDANGNMTEDEQGRTFIWDAWNRLVEVKQGSTTLVEYRYDGLKRRIIEDDGTTEKHLYYSDQWQVLEERGGGNAVTQYVWSPVYVDAMILRDRDADASSGNGLEERIYVLHDANFNVTAITDASGTVLERYAYEAYGRPFYLDANFDFLPDAQSDHSWQHLHQGGRLDQATGNYHFRNRDSSPGIGRWLSKDPIGFEAGDANLYRYVGNGPGNRVDPSGLAFVGTDHLGQPRGERDLIDIITQPGPADFVNPISGVGKPIISIGGTILDSCWSGIKQGCNNLKNWWSGVDSVAPKYGATPQGRPFTKHYGTETGPVRNIPGSVVDNTINTTTGVPVKGDKTVHYDPGNNVTFVTGDGGSIVSVHKGPPRKGQLPK